MDKRKLLIMAISMNLGGTERSLINFISDLAPEKYDITLLLLERKGDLLDLVPSHVTIKEVEGYKVVKPFIQNGFKANIRNMFGSYHKGSAFPYLVAYSQKKMLSSDTALLKYFTSFLKSNETVYDLAIAYAGPMDLITYYIAKCIKARRKYQWIHFDIEKIGFSEQLVKKTYPLFDRIFVVSDEGREKMINKYPALAHKVRVFKNKVCPDIIRTLAEEKGFNLEKRELRILTVGRLSEEKGQEIIFPVIKEFVKKNDIPFKWYLIGTGPEMKRYQTICDQYDLNDYVKFLGSVLNPYPYMKECDLYVQTSKHEGFCLTLAEAKIFNKPILSTDFTGSKEQLTNYWHAKIVPYNEQMMYNEFIIMFEKVYKQNTSEQEYLLKHS